MKQIMFETRIKGFSCHCIFNEASDTYQLTNTKGYRVYWLEKQLQPEDKYQLIEEIKAALFARKYGIEY